jgi:hypothetical protein
MKAASGAAILALCLGAIPLAAQEQSEKPIYTYVAEYKLKPGKDAEFWAYFEKTTQPLLDQLVADGTLLEWARTSSIVHTADAMPESLWFCTRSVGSVTKVLEKIAAARPSNVVDAIDKHNDRLLESVVFKTGAKRGTSGYLETSRYTVKPGRGKEWLDAFKRFYQPVFENLLEKGAIMGYGIDREYVHTMPTGYRGLWVLLPDSDAIDTQSAAFDTAFNARSPEEGRAIQMSLADMTVEDEHRDGLERVVRYVRK